jgi:hypothetical protein
MAMIGNTPYLGIINSGNIQDGSIDTVDIKDGAVTSGKLAPGAAVPSQTGQAGKYLTTDGTDASWATVVTGMSITSLAYPGNDLAVDITTPGACTLIGTNFEAGSIVYIDTISTANSASSITISGTTQITFTPPAKAAATYNVWVVSPTGKIAVLANGIQYSGTPSWAGQSTSLSSTTAVNIQLSASGDTPLVYTLVSGTLPTGVTLSSTGLLSGTATGLSANTTFPNIVVRAEDPQNQDSSVTLSLSITVQHQISRSLRFNSADSAYLNRTLSTPTDGSTWTVSVWVKRSSISGNYQYIFSYGAVGNTSSRGLAFDGTGGSSTDSLYLYNGTASIYSTPRYRDPSAWSHVVVSCSAGTANVYVNNGASVITTTMPAMANTTVFDIGRWMGGPNFYLSGYLADFHFIDGQALTPASFGQVSSTTGVWEPKAYTGAYGTNGFYLNFADNSSVSALGTDASGRGNNFTPNNFSVTAGAGNDSLVDSPTSYGTDTGAGGEVRGNYATLNPLVAQGTAGGGLFTYSNGNLDIVGPVAGSGLGGYAFALGTISFTSGKWYYEATPTDVGGSEVGIAQSTYTGGTYGELQSSGSINYYFNGSLYVDGAILTTLSSYTDNDVISVAVDADAKKVWFAKNGTWQGSGTQNPATGSGGFSYSWTTPVVFALGDGQGGNNASMSMNTGQRPFAYTAPSGFKALCTQNLPEPTVVQGDDYFNTVLYTGAGGTQSVTGVGFQPDLLWLKRRDAGNAGRVFDAVRGKDNYLLTSSTAAEANAAYLSSFDSNGFTLNSGDSATNTSGATYVAWNWKANGSGSTNTAGTITSTVSANTTSGFSIVTWSGTGSGTATVGHGLGATPSMVILKFRNTLSAWSVYHASLGNTKRVTLNTTDAEATSSGYWNNTSPTSSVFTLGIDFNQSFNYVAYCFAPVAGYSAFGSYTGNGSADGPFVYTGFRPAFVLIKNSSNSGYSWYLFDNERLGYNPNNNFLTPNSSAAETTYTTGPDQLSNGFKLRDTDAAWNGSGNTYIYACFAENPFKYSLAR